MAARRDKWLVSTRDSTYLFDLAQRTVIRIPGAGAQPTVNDRVRPLREIARCRVGEPGLWTMNPDSGWSDVDYYWAQSSVIRLIEPIQELVQAPSNNGTGDSDSDSDSDPSSSTPTSVQQPRGPDEEN
jgi:hypothetical protein